MKQHAAMVVLPFLVAGGLTREPEFSFHGDRTGARFGSAVAVLSDIDDDDVLDIAVAAPSDGSAVPYVGAYSGADGHCIWMAEGHPLEECIGDLAAGGDLNKDGVGDLLVGYPSAVGRPSDPWDRVWVLSGRTGDRLLELLGDDDDGTGSTGGGLFGTAIAWGGDLDGDEVPDIWVGAPATPGVSGQVTAFSGATGNEIRRLSVAEARYFGSALAANTGNIGDSALDLVVVGGYTDPALFVFSKWAKLVYQVPIGGVTAATAQVHFTDLDNDEVPEIVVGGGRAVTVISGLSGTVLFRFAGNRGEDLGAVQVVPDTDGDGHLDLALGMPGKLGGTVEVRSPKSGRVLWIAQGNNPSGSFGAALAVDDLDADGTIELIVGEPGQDGKNLDGDRKLMSGSVHVFSLK
jgi:hypothetical protein